jgi:hypothetical protein
MFKRKIEIPKKMKTEDLRPDWRPLKGRNRFSLEEKMFIKRFYRETNRITSSKGIEWNSEDVRLLLELLRFIRNLS